MPNKSCLILGIGHAGGVVISALRKLRGYREIEILALDTDSFDLKQLQNDSGVDTLLLGEEAVGGKGTGGDVELAENIFNDEAERLAPLFANRRLIVVVAGLGGGTGSAVNGIMTPLTESGAQIIYVVQTPFAFESSECQKRSLQALGDLAESYQTIVEISNEKLLESHADLAPDEAFQEASLELAKVAAALTTPFSTKNLFNVSPNLFIPQNDEISPRCSYLICDGNGDTPAQELLNKLTATPSFKKAQKEILARGIVLLRVNGNCRESDLEQLHTQLKQELPDIPLNCATCIDSDMSTIMRLTLLLYPFKEHFGEDIPENKEPLSVPASSPMPSRKDEQLEIQFSDDGLGLFAGDPENNWKGQNIDIPTFKRLNIPIVKGTLERK